MDDVHDPPTLTGELGRYRISKRLGQGGFGITWLARDRNLDRDVAIKQFYPAWYWSRTRDDPSAGAADDDAARYARGLASFLAEARLLAGIAHPNCVQVYDVVEQGGTGYMVMAYERGRSLEQLYKTNDVDNEKAFLRLVMPVLDVLELLHGSGIVHADIKPDNIVIRPDGTPVLLDFGSTRAHTEPDPSARAVDDVAGAQEPDQSRTKDGHYGPWTDMFALGRTLYAGVNRGLPPPSALTRSRAIGDGDADPMEPASRAGRGRYSAPFLRAIDAVLHLDLEELPRDVAAWRKLFPGPGTNASESGPSSGIDSRIASRLLSQDEAAIRIAALKIPEERLADYQAWLTEELFSAHVERRLGALTALFELGHPELESLLMRLTAETRWSVKRRAVFYLGEMRATAAIPTVSALMSHGNAGIRAEAREALRKIRADA